MRYYDTAYYYESVPMRMSLIALLTPAQKTRLLRSRGTLSDEARSAFAYTWEFWARPEQLPPAGNWRIWLILAGRGWGKTRCLSEWVRSQIEAGHGRGGLIARTSRRCSRRDG